MSHEFRLLLKKIASGTHTNKELTREEMAQAMALMFTQDATPAQIGAFLVAHRLKRPSSAELAGILDAYDRFGQKFKFTLGDDQQSNPLPVVFGLPYDGRDRTVPVFPLVALILLTQNIPVITHGSDRFPTKYGICLRELWQCLGLGCHHLSFDQAQQLFQETGFGFLYLPHHFLPAQNLMPYRDQIGKRPPLASAELIWTPYAGPCQLISGFVHPPTEARFQDTLALRGRHQYVTVKGLEGGTDLSLNRTAIVGIQRPNQEFERCLINPEHYGFRGHDVPLQSLSQIWQEYQHILRGQSSPLTSSVIFNGGFYLWILGQCDSLEKGFSLAETLLHQGQVLQTLDRLKHCCKP